MTFDARRRTTITQAIKTTQPCAKVVLDPIMVNGGPRRSRTATFSTSTALVGNPAIRTPGGTVQIPSTLLGVESGSNCGTPVGPARTERGSWRSVPSAASSTSTSRRVGRRPGTLAIGKTHTQDRKLQVAYDTEARSPRPTSSAHEPVGGASVPSGTFDDSITLRSTATSEQSRVVAEGRNRLQSGRARGDFEVRRRLRRDGHRLRRRRARSRSYAQFYRGATTSKGDERRAPTRSGVTVEIIDRLRVLGQRRPSGSTGISTTSRRRTDS